MSKRLTPEAYQKIESMLAYGAHKRAIARAVGYSASTVTNISLGRVTPPAKPLPSILEVLGPVKTTVGDPTPDEISEACEKLRRHRPRGESEERAWTAPVVPIFAMGGAS